MVTFFCFIHRPIPRTAPPEIKNKFDTTYSAKQQSNNDISNSSLPFLNDYEDESESVTTTTPRHDANNLGQFLAGKKSSAAQATKNLDSGLPYLTKPKETIGPKLEKRPNVFPNG